MPSLCLIANQSMKLVRGMLWGNHTSLCQCTWGRGERIAFQEDLEEKAPEEEGLHMRLSLCEILGTMAGGIASFNVSSSVEFVTGQCQFPSLIIVSTQASRRSAES